MEFDEQDIPGLYLIEPNLFHDNRGYFYEVWQDRLFESTGLKNSFVQENCSFSVKGVLRGMHYQIKHSQVKLVRVTSGIVFDVAIDIRKSSPSFGKWVGKVLSAENKYQFWIPSGFAHGYYVISDTAELVYKTTDYYFPEHERTIKWDDPAINISWPLDGTPNLSEKDSKGTLLQYSEVFD